MIDVKIKSKVW